MDRIVECIPNFSEGCDSNVIGAITAAIEAVDGVQLLDCDPGKATNRTVVTFAGSPEGVEEAAVQAIKTASELIDMSTHSGAHPRQGATDVCPLCPVSGVTMEDCVALSKKIGERVGAELGIPVYLYEFSATRPERKLLPDIRVGEYEALAGKLGKPEWAPDYGPNEFTDMARRAGATVIGAREFLIAYNLNLNTRDSKYASDIAMEIRETGRLQRGPSPTKFYSHGEIERDATGKGIKKAGRFQFVKGVGWYIEEYGVAQISLNLTNYKVTPVHTVYDECVRLADERGLRITGSELVGLVPFDALLAAGRHYLAKQHRSTGVPEEELVHIAVKSLGLDELGPFDPAKKIIEYRFRETPPLVGLDLRGFVNEVSSDSMAPGGGSVAALAGSIGAGLATMVANLTAGKKSMFDRFEEMGTLADRGQEVKDALLRAVDEDTEAFNRIIAASRLPKKSDDEKAARAAAIEAANQYATTVPLRTAELCLEALKLAKGAAGRGNPSSITDAGVAALMARAGFEGALLNVKINLPGVKDEAFQHDVKQRREALFGDFGPLYSETIMLVEKGLAAQQAG
jgi:glutamate formiminotransferase / formiminotetrahydrofolate cyclodeaminase